LWHFSLPSFVWVDSHLLFHRVRCNVGGGSGGCLGCTLIVCGCSWHVYDGFFGGRLLIVADFVFALVFFLRFGFIDAMGSSSDVKSVDPCILIKRSMFLPCDVVHMGNCIFCGSVNIYNGGGSWWGISRAGVVGSFLVCDKNSYVLVRWRKIMSSRITAT
jgi:hypothetical protein